MVEPVNFGSEEDGREWIKKTFEKLSQGIDSAKTREEKLSILRSFNFDEINPENNTNDLTGKISENQDYIKTKELLLDFFQWLEREHKINTSLEVYLNSFFAQSQNQKMILFARKLKKIKDCSVLEQVEIILYGIRTLYELGLRQFMIILEAYLKKNKEVEVNENLGLKDLKENFSNYPKIKKIRDLFKDRYRDSISHENWILDGNEIVFKNKNNEIRKSFLEVMSLMGELIFLTVALQSCAMSRYKHILNTSQISDEQISNLCNNFKRASERMRDPLP